MKKLFDELSYEVSKCTTRKYSTSFSLGILALKPSIRSAIYAIYGYVRLADEIVDSFHDYNKEKLLSRLKKETYNAIEEGISLNPILQAFQQTVHDYRIDRELIDTFLHSMEMDLQKLILILSFIMNTYMDLLKLWGSCVYRFLLKAIKKSLKNLSLMQ